MDRHSPTWFTFTFAVLLAVCADCHAESAPSLQKGLFLVASKNLDGGAFERSVIYLTEHTSAGSLGFIINKPHGFTLQTLLPQFSAIKAPLPLYRGGPILPNNLFALLGNTWSEAYRVEKNIYLIGGLENIIPMIEAQRDQPLILIAGYAGWAPRQLNKEISNGDWILAPSSSNLLFSKQNNLWQRLYNKWAGNWI